MKNEYIDSLHNIEMSEERKNALIDTLTKEIEATNMTSIIEMPAMAAKRKRTKTPFRFAAAIAACLVVGSSMAYAASPYVTVGDAFDALFNGAPAKTEVMDSIGRPVGATATAGGVTITADAIIGDANTLSIVYSVTFDDGIPEAVSDPDRALIMHGGFHVIGADGAAGSAYFYDADPTDSTLQYVQQMFVDADGGIIGRTCIVEFTEIMSWYAGTEEAAAGQAEELTLAKGNWNMRFTIDYEDSTVAFEAGKVVAIDGDSFAIETINLSPVSITIDYETGFRVSPDSGDSYASRMKPSCPCAIVMDDGSRIEIDFDEFALTAMPADNGGTSCRISKTFQGVVDISQVSLIKIGDTPFAIVG